MVLIDVYFYHRDNEAIPASELIEVMEEFRKEGKIRYYACSNWSTARMKEADAYAASKGYRGFVANEALFNIASASMKPLEDDTLKIMDQEMQQYHIENPQNLAMPYMSVASGFFHKLYAGGADAVRNSEYYTPENLKIAEGLHFMVQEISKISKMQWELFLFHSLKNIMQTDFSYISSSDLYAKRDCDSLF